MVYARNEANIRSILWQELEQIGAGCQEPWLLSGDFNNVLTTDDRVGQPVTESEVRGFKNMIHNLQLTPIRSKGIYYTLCNKQQGTYEP